MPYLKFLLTDKTYAQLSGNSYDDFVKAFDKNGKIAHRPQAEAWVKAYFLRRDLTVKKQKAERKELPGANLEEIMSELDDALDDEEDKKEEYDNVCQGKKASTSSETDEKRDDGGSSGNGANQEGNPYASSSTTRNVVTEDLF